MNNRRGKRGSRKHKAGTSRQGAAPAFTPQAALNNASSHRLYRQTVPDTRRRNITLPTAQDHKKDLNSYTHTQLLRLGRLLYENTFFGGIIREMANYTVGNGFKPAFQGMDTDWGNMVEERLANWGKVCNLRGRPFNWTTDLRLADIAISRCGDVLAVFTENEFGAPRIQYISAHRLGSRGMMEAPESTPYAGLPAYNGVIHNQFGKPVAYQVLGETEAEDIYIPARDAHLLFDPEWVDQGRGVPLFAKAFSDISDEDDITSLEMQALKIFATETFIEYTETGEATDEGDDFAAEGETAAGAGKMFETREGGAYRVAKANSGVDWKPLESNRPSPNWREFNDRTIKRVFESAGWPYEFSYGLKDLKGAVTRMVVRKAMTHIERRQGILAAFAERATIWAVAKLHKRGDFDLVQDWWKWGHSTPKQLTVDIGHDGKNEREDYKLGLSTLRDQYASKGQDWQVQLDQKIQERKYLEDKCADAGIDPATVQLLTNTERNASDPSQNEDNHDDNDE